VNCRLTFAVVLLAAGASSRMGRPKLLLPWEDTSVLGHLLAQWQRVGAAQTTLVRRADDAALDHELTRLGFDRANCILNPDPDRGMFSSIRCAAQWTGWRTGLTHWVIALGDQPHVRLRTLRALLDFAADHPDRICQPARQGRTRHPVLLPKDAFFQLAETGAPTLKAFLRARVDQIACCELDDAGLDLDLDRPEDYERALALFARPTLHST
jgi:molybdenum cofactor cytidylyltransferase